MGREKSEDLMSSEKKLWKKKFSGSPESSSKSRSLSLLKQTLGAELQGFLSQTLEALVQ